MLSFRPSRSEIGHQRLRRTQGDVRLQRLKNRCPVARPLLLQRRHRVGNNRLRPRTIKHQLGRLLRWQLLHLLFDVLKMDRDHDFAPSALLRALAPPFLSHEPLKGRQQVGAEPATALVCGEKAVSLHHPNQKALHQILRILHVLPPRPRIDIQRTPVTQAQLLPRLPQDQGLSGLFRGDEQGPLGGWKRSVGHRRSYGQRT